MNLEQHIAQNDEDDADLKEFLVALKTIADRHRKAKPEKKGKKRRNND